MGIRCLWGLKWRSLSSVPLSKYYLCLKIWLMQLYFSGQMEKDRKEITFTPSLSWGDSSLKCQHYWCIDIIKDVCWNVTAAAQRSDGRLWLGDVLKQHRQIAGMPWSPLMSPCFTSDGNLLKARRASESYTNDYSRSLIVLTVSNMERFRMNFPHNSQFLARSTACTCVFGPD